ncbi:MAG: 3-oxoacyl-ACP synthase III, partial [Gemmataceae bacterium]|nr:3-oxoacyl-ACP synthase III [Gemmataceae bacterium]
MKYNRVHLEAIGYELPPVVVSTAELESRLAPVYQALKMAPGQLELLTGISERRWWEPGYPLSRGAALAAKKALASADLTASDIDVLIYAGVCRENFEPATACAVANELNLNPNAAIFDLSNACLGVLNGIVEIANRIELGQARAGLVVSAETSREINENVIDRMVRTKSVELFRESIATLTGGSGAVAVLVVGEELSREKRRKLLGGATQNAP